MDAVTTAQRMTADEFLAFEWDEWPRRQLIDGEVVVNEPSLMHGYSQNRISFALEAWIRSGPARGLVALPLDVVLDQGNVYAPDLLWYENARVPKLTDLAPYPIPDLAVEIRSPSTWRRDTGVKKATYERHGVAELWLVDTATQVVWVFRRSAADRPAFDVTEELDRSATLTSPLLPGFSLSVAEIFSASR